MSEETLWDAPEDVKAVAEKLHSNGFTYRDAGRQACAWARRLLEDPDVRPKWWIEAEKQRYGPAFDKAADEARRWRLWNAEANRESPLA